MRQQCSCNDRECHRANGHGNCRDITDHRCRREAVMLEGDNRPEMGATEWPVCQECHDYAEAVQS